MKSIILYKSEISAILKDGSVSIVRRINAKFSISECDSFKRLNDQWFFITPNGDGLGLKCPYGDFGSTFWVKENWTKWGCDFRYEADGNIPADMSLRPSSTMPQYASRISVKIDSVTASKNIQSGIWEWNLT